jgi:excisionase family DNA binding protein
MTTNTISQLELCGMPSTIPSENESPALPPRATDAVATKERRLSVPANTRMVPKRMAIEEQNAPSPSMESLQTFAQAARVLGISLRQFRRLVDGGKIAFVKVSERSPRVRPSELQRFLDASAVKYSEVQS